MSQLALTNHATLSPDGTAAHSAYMQLKSLITTLEFPPGSTIREPSLQERLGIGRTPLREALHRLAQERMLHIYPRRAIVVAKLGVTEIRQIFETRVVVEAAAAGLAAVRITEGDLRDLITLGMGLQASRSVVDVSTFLEADQQFHRQLADYAQNVFLEETIDRLQALNLWLWHTYFSSNNVRLDDLFEHEPIIQAIAQHDPDAAAEAMRNHVLSSKEQLLAGL